jgi:hypothetical protein
MATLNIKNSFSITVNGKTIEGWQGTSATNDADDFMSVTVDGNDMYQQASLADASARTLWDDDDDSPADFDYFFFCATQDVDLQIIAATLNVTLPVKAGFPFVLSYDDILAAIATTPIVADSTPAYEEIDSIRINNRSGSAASYVFFVVD